MKTDETQSWTVRAVRAGPQETRVFCRNHAFAIGSQAGLVADDAAPSALEHLLGALAGDLMRALEAQTARRGVAIHAMELSLHARLDNPLVHLGVVGEEGHAGLSSVAGTLYVSADVDEADVAPMWRAALDRSPLYQTLARAATLDVNVRLVP